MRALVLGGGGITGVAWQWGVIAGLADAGIDLTKADLVIGTSAGSVVGSQLASGADVQERFDTQLAGPGSELATSLAPLVIARWAWAVVSSQSAERAGRRIGRFALAAKTEPFESRREALASRLPVDGWPEHRLLIAAVDAQSGERVVFDRDAGVELIDAVCASCAVPGVWPPIAIDGHRYIDGGVHSAANADLAAGADRIVIVAPLGRGLRPGRQRRNPGRRPAPQRQGGGIAAGFRRPQGNRPQRPRSGSPCPSGAGGSRSGTSRGGSRRQDLDRVSTSTTLVGMGGPLREHWEQMYTGTGATQVSWFQPSPDVSLRLIEQLELPTDRSIVDVGGGAATLVDALLARGYSDITVLDLSQAALDATHDRLGNALDDRVHLECQDVLTWQPSRRFDLWHDRAMFHFLVDPGARATYVDVLRAATSPGSQVVLGTFAADGPERCSGLPVARYGPESLAAALGADFTVVATDRQEHVTPGGATQPFTWLSATRVA
jgi:NTE family protein